MLIRQRKVRYLPADLWTGAVAVVLCFHELAPVVGGDILSAGSVFADHFMKHCGFGLLVHYFLFRAAARLRLSNAGARLEGHTLVGFATCGKDCLGQVLRKLDVCSRACQSAFHKRDGGLEGPSIASTSGASSAMRLEGCAYPFRELSVVPS